MIPKLLSSVLLALAATWTIRAYPRYPDRLLLFSVFACSGIALSFESLSFLNRLEISAIRVAIGGSVLVALAGVRLMSRSIPENDRNDDWTPIGNWAGWRLLGTSPKDPARFFEASVSIILFVILAATAFVALSSVPNNWDSMTYHLPRIEHWLQNKNLNYYPTSIIRQLDSNPFAEELILALRSVIDLYPLANMVQWMSFAGCIMANGQICRQLGGSRQAQSLAHALAATLPMGILQASSTQNDLVVAFFSATCVYFVLRVQMEKIYSLAFPVIVAAVLAFHTKGTAAIFILGFVVVYGTQILLRLPPINFWRNSIIACLLAAGIVGGYFSRNLQQFGTLLGPSSNPVLTREPNWGGTMLNAVRDVAINLYFPNATIRSDIADFVSLTQKQLAISQAEDDDRYTFESQRFVFQDPVHEDIGSNAIHTLIIMVTAAIALCLALSSRKSEPAICVSLQLSARDWAVHVGILHIIKMAALDRTIGTWRLHDSHSARGPAAALKIMPPKFLVFILAVLSIQSYEFAFRNKSRPIFGNWSVATASAEDVLFANRPGLKADYLRLAGQLAQARAKRVGLFIGGDSWEFPIWYLLRRKLPDQEIPAIVHETNENTIDPAAEFLVYIDRTASASVVEKMTPVAGFDQIHLYRRVQTPPPQ